MSSIGSMMPDAEQVAPEPVDVALGEVRVVLRGDPRRPAARGGGASARRLVRGTGTGTSAASPAPVRSCFTSPCRLSATISYERLGPLDGRAADRLAAAGSGRPCRPTWAKYAASLVVLVLRPALERVVVALVAVEPDGQEQLRRVLHRRRPGRGGSCSTTAGGFSRVRPAGRQDLARRTGRRACSSATCVADPLAEGGGALVAEELAVDLEQVGPLVRPVLDVVVAADQPVDQRVALGSRVAACRRGRPGRRRPSAAGRSGRGRRGGGTRRRCRAPTAGSSSAASLAATSSSIRLYAGGCFQAKPVRSPMTVSVVAA